MCVIFVNMKTATIREAQHHLSKLIARIESGEKIVLTRRGKKVAKIEAYQEEETLGGKVDWATAIRETRESLANLPKFDDSIVEIMRRDERF
jgi:antitoxin (DNA-binding transcriptional repressor) of toxin-antitoxin stability system